MNKGFVSQPDRDGYRRLTKLTVAMGVLALILSAILFGLILTTPSPKYYATTMSGEVMTMHALSEPVVTEDYLLQWASLAARQALNINFVSPEKSLEKSKPNFTPSGWSQLSEQMKKSGLLASVTDQKVDVSAVVFKTPVVVSTAVLHGRFTWHVQLPMLVTLSSASATTKQRMLVTMDVQRISTLNAYKGIQINTFVVGSM